MSTILLLLLVLSPLIAAPLLAWIGEDDELDDAHIHEQHGQNPERSGEDSQDPGVMRLAA